MIDEPLRTVRVKRTAQGFVVPCEPVPHAEALPLSLSEAAHGDAVPRAAPTTPLTSEQAREMLAPLPPAPEEGEDRPAEASGPISAPTTAPPRPREASSIPFPESADDAAPDAAGGGGLQVVCRFPVGEAAVAPYLSVTFNQPMIAAASQADLSADDVPVKLTPAIPGRWRWLGTDTLLFEAGSDSARRLPMATAYSARIAAGTVSVGGAVLAGEAAWMFDTPAPTLRKHPLYRRRSYGRQPVLFAAFDQRIDPTVVVKHVRLISEGGRAYPVRLATDAEIAADPQVMRLIDATPADHWLAAVPEEPLPTVLTLMLTFVEGTPSAEGPLVARRAQRFRFGVRGPLQLSSHWCDGEECTPSGDWTLTFSNDLDPDAFDPALISISPELDEVTFTVFRHTDYAGSWTGIRISGRKRPGTQYRVTVHAGLKDVFGQTLKEDDSAHFSVGGLPPGLDTAWGSMTVLDPSRDPVLPIHTINIGTVMVRAYRVAPEQYPAYRRWRSLIRHNQDHTDAPGERVLDEILNIDGPPDTRTETYIRLGGLLGSSPGHLVVEVRPVSALTWLSDAQVRQLWGSSTTTWVQATRLGLAVFVDRRQALVWTSRLGDGAPSAGATVEVSTPDVKEVSDDTGVTRLPSPGGNGSLVIVRADNDTAILPLEPAESPDVVEDDRNHEVRIFAFSDRTLCHPGDTVAIKGWLRRVGRGPHGAVTLFDAAAATSVEYRVMEASENGAIVTGRARLSPVGGFHFQFELPQTADPGWSTIYLRPVGGTLEARDVRHPHRLLVQEHHRSECAVDVEVRLVRDHSGSGHAVATVNEADRTGSPLAAAEVEWVVTATEEDFRPLNWTGCDSPRTHSAGFTFGVARPWWLAADDDEGDSAALREGPCTARFRSRTDAAGSHRLRIDFASGAGTYPVRIDATATVFDRNRQSASNSADLLVHADHYVGLRSRSNFVNHGEPLVVEVAVIRGHGEAVAGHTVALRAARLEWKHQGGEWREVEREVQERTVVTTTASAPDAGPEDRDRFAACTFETPRAGRYRITATVVDAAGRRHHTELTRWVSNARVRPHGPAGQQKVVLVPNRDRYFPGENAEILVQTPFVPAEGMLTLRRDGLVSSERFSMEGPTCTLRIPVEERFVPSLHVRVDLVGAVRTTEAVVPEPPDAPRQPARAIGSLSLPIVPLSGLLQVVVAAQRECLEPGDATPIDVWVSDADGRPATDAELTVVIADATVPAAAWRPPDPGSEFHHERGGGVSDYHNRTCILAVEQASPSTPGAPHDDEWQQADTAVGAPQAAPPLLFAPKLLTDALGQARVTVTATDRTVRYRVLAVAAAGEHRFGVGEANLTVRRGLTMRVAAPRFLNLGDRFALAASLHNRSGGAMDVQVAIHADNAELTAQEGERVAGVSVSVSPEERVEVRVPAAPVGAGSARFRFRAVAASGSPSAADAVTVELPVLPPATTETSVACGAIDSGGAVVWPVSPSRSALPGHGGLEVSLSATPLLTITDAFLHVWRRPHVSSEQIASRILAAAALRDVMPSFVAAGLPTRDVIVATMNRDLKELQALQHGEGGFPIWERNGEVWPYHSVHAAHALARAHQSRYAVPDGLIERALDYLRKIERHIDTQRYSLSHSRSLKAYALYVRTLLDDPDQAAAAWMVDAGFEHLTLESVGWLLSVLATDPAQERTVREVLDFLGNPRSAAAVTSKYEHLLLHSDVRTDAVLLETLVTADPENGMIRRLADGLLARRVEGRWATTQENVWALLALRRYFDMVEAEPPDFKTRVWLGERHIDGHEFRCRTSQSARVEVPLSDLQAGRASDRGAIPLTVQQEGDGRLYYRLGLRHAPTATGMAPAEHGLSVMRKYEAVDDPGDARRDRDGIWRVRCGSRVLVKLTLTALARRAHVVLVDPLPAGLEPLGPAPMDVGEPPARWWEPPWYEHHDLRDTRAEAFTSLLPGGVHEYRYLTRAATVGAFTAPPARVEAMYTPNTFGRTATDQVVVA